MKSMKHSTKGALLSGIVLPGLGQMAQKHYGRGIALILVVSAGVAAILVKAFWQATAIMEQMIANDRPIDLSTITDAAIQVTSASGNLTYRIALLAIVASWIAGIVDAYVTGRRMDIDSEARTSAPPSESR